MDRPPAAPPTEQAPHLAVLGGAGRLRFLLRFLLLRLTLDLSPLRWLHQLGRLISRLEEIKTKHQGQEGHTDRETDSTA